MIEPPVSPRPARPNPTPRTDPPTGAVRSACGTRGGRILTGLAAVAGLLVLPVAVPAPTLGPLTPRETHALTAPDGAPSANFGWAVSVSGSFAAVGAPGAISGRGTVYLFARNQGGADEWQLVRQITVADAGTGDHFGTSLSLSGDTLAVGAPDNNKSGTDAGRVYVFERNLGGADQWGLLTEVASSDLSAGDHFGSSVSLDLNLLAVGAYDEKPGGVGKGAAYVFHRNFGAGWFGQVARLLASDGAASDEFGAAVAVNGDRVVVGAPMDDNEHGQDAGAAYLFTRDHGGYNQWGQVRKFSGESEQDHYGRAVAIRGSHVLLGAPDSDAGGSYGRAYLYERNQGGADAWGWIKTLVGGSAAGCRFGGAVAIDPPRALVGAPLERAGSVAGGAVFVFDRDEGGWSQWGQQTRLLAADRAANDYFGAAVAIDGNVALGGAHGDDPKGSGSGSARLLRWVGNRWSFEHKLTNSHPAYGRAGDQFGTSVTLQDDRLAAGAPRPAVYGFWGDITSEGNPSVAIFRRHVPGQSQPWTQGALLAYDDLGEDDHFGTAVAMQDDRLVVGAPLDRASYPRGMSYAFDRNQGGADAWGQVARLNQHNRHNLERIGQYIALDGDTAIVGSAGVFWEEGDGWGWSVSGVASGLVGSFDPDDTAEGGNTYIYCRDAGGQSRAWDYRKRIELWSMAEVVAIAGNQFVIGLPSRKEVQIFGRNVGGKDQWSRVKTLAGPAGTRDWGFGGAVAFDGNTLAVGPWVPGVFDGQSGSFPEGDSVWIYQRNAGGADNWGLVREIQLGFTFGAAGFGGTLALSGEALVVGAVGQSDLSGGVYLFERNIGGADRWGLTQQFTAPQAWPNAWFGQSLAFDHNLVAVGAPGDDQSTPSGSGSFILWPQAGAVYLFGRGGNRAPTMAHTPGTGSFTVSEDTAPGWIFALKASTLVQRAQTADADGDLCGLAVIGANNTGGQWQYSLDGTSWSNLQVASPTQARMLDPQSQLRFVPALDYHGIVATGLVYRAWDRSLWDAGGQADASEPGGSSPFSQETEVLGCQVLPLNDRPVLDRTGNPFLPTLYANILPEYNRGQSVSNVLQNIVTDADNDRCGLGVTKVFNTHGTWEYSLDAGASWRAFGTVNPGSARLLGPLDRIRFQPFTDYSGTLEGGLSLLAWDQTSGSPGNVVNTQTGTALSLDTTVLSVVVTPEVNHAPVLDLFGEPKFPSIARGATVIEGTPISDLLGSWVVDLDGDECGIALAQTDSTHGTWEYSRNLGAPWLPVGTVSFDAALLLGPEARLRFLPAPDYSGTILVAVMYRAWDQSEGTHGTRVNAQVSGGETSLSIGIEPAPLTVSGTANRAPVLASPGQVSLTPVRQDETDPAGDRVSDVIRSVVTDADGDACGIAIFGMTYNFGTWEYSANRGTTWTRLDAVSPQAARLLGPDTALRLIPAAGFSGTVTNGLEFRAWDRSAGTEGSTASLTIFGGGTGFSGRTGRIGITVAPLNHAPRLLATTPLALTPIRENQFDNPGDVVSNLLHRATTDADGDSCGLAVIQVPDTLGAWQYSLDNRRTWNPLTSSRLGYARLLGPSNAVRFVPDSGFSGRVTNGFRFHAWDQSSGKPGDLLLPRPRINPSTALSTDTGSVEIDVQEANRRPVALHLNPGTVAEGQPARTVVGELSAEDPNPGDTHTFDLVAGLGDEDNASFLVTDNRLVTAAVFDREAKDHYDIRIRVRDPEGASLTQPLVVTVRDVNDSAPTAIRLSPATLAENQPAGSVVGRLSAADADLDSTHTFALVAGDGDTDNTRFAIRGDSLVTTAALDYEAAPTLQIRVGADDGHNPVLARVLAVVVLDADDNLPPRGLTLTPTCLLESSPPDTAVGAIGALDPNLHDRPTFSLASGEGDHDNASFQIRGGILYTATTMNFATHTPYRVRLQADDGRGGTVQRAFEIVPAVPLWHEDFETGWGPWTHAADLGTDGWELTTDLARSPTHSLAVPVDANPSDASALSAWIDIPADTTQLRLQLYHRHDGGPGPEAPVDAGVLEWRHREEPWQDVLVGEAALRVVLGGYGPTLASEAEHPLGGRRAWTGTTTQGFVPVVVALDAPSLAGHSVQFRWRQAAVSGLTSRRWAIDDITLAAVGTPHGGTNEVPFRIVSGQVGEGRLELTWESVPGQPYTVEYRPAAASGAWTPAFIAPPGRAGSTTTAASFDLRTLPGHPHRELYFRLRSP